MNLGSFRDDVRQIKVDTFQMWELGECLAKISAYATSYIYQRGIPQTLKPIVIL